MQRLTTKSVSEIASVITAGGLAVIPTDTLNVSVHVDDGDKRNVQPSRLISIDENGNIEFLR